MTMLTCGDARSGSEPSKHGRGRGMPGGWSTSRLLVSRRELIKVAAGDYPAVDMEQRLVAHEQRSH
jgi:hypothetical protein